MNDDELITVVKKSVTDVHMNIPPEQVVSRSRAIRVRRRIPFLTAALGVAAATALAVTTLLPGTHQPRPGPQPSARLAAWTVATQADGNISVTIRELRDPAGLQRKLRADGVPASVTFFGQRNPSCRPYPASAALWDEIFPSAIVIDPSAIPSGVGVQIDAGFNAHPPPGGPAVVIPAPGLVQASPQCTGS